MLDHVVLATTDVDATAAEIATATGVTPSPGGPHVGRGTRNSLCAFADGSYLEIIGPDPDQPDPAEPRAFGVDRLAVPGMAAWCAKTHDIASLISRGGAAGLPVAGPIPMQRQAPDGLLSWELALPEFDTRHGVVPFFIDWADSPHPSTAAAPGLRLSRFEGADPDPAETHRVLGALGVHLPVHLATPLGLTMTVSGPDGDLTVGPAQFR